MKSVVMDIVVADVPPKFGMLLSRAWIKRLGVALQNDLSYAIVPFFRGEQRRLYREEQLAYIINDEKEHTNHPIYSVDTGLGSCILQIDDSQSSSLQLRKSIYQSSEVENTLIWSMFFDGACSRESAGEGVVFVSPSKETIHLSFKLDFKVTNNIAEYEALVLGLNVAKDMNIQGLKVYGDDDLIQQIKNTFQAKHVRIKAYRDEVCNIINSFLFIYS
jgi:hypothetical protein